MAHVRPLSRYPLSYWSLCELAATQDEIPPMAFSSPAQARSFRNVFYRFRAQLLRENQGEWERHAQAANGLRLHINGPVVSFTKLGLPQSKP